MPVPVTVLTGFLGSGKTTLLRYILQEPHGLKIAVIQNEFADEMGIEAPTLVDSNGDPVEGFKELPNGCICCSAKDEFIASIDALFAHGATFDYIVVESTGLADPLSVIGTFWVDDMLGSSIFLDAVICLVDSSRIKHTLEEGEPELRRLAHKQVLCADVVLCNKTDLCDAPRDIVERINPLCTVMETQFGKTALDNLLNLKAFDGSRCAEKLKAIETPTHTHHRVRSIVLKPSAGVLCPDKVERWMSEVLWEKTCGSVIRAKGIFRASNEAVYQMQAVGDLFEVTDVTSCTKGSDIESKFLFLGDDLVASDLQDGLSACVA